MRVEIDIPADEAFALRQRLAHPGRYYGDGGTLHRTGRLDVEVHQGRVVAVWFRCQLLPFRQHETDANRAAEMRLAELAVPRLTGVEVVDHGV